MTSPPLVFEGCGVLIVIHISISTNKTSNVNGIRANDAHSFSQKQHWRDECTKSSVSKSTTDNETVDKCSVVSEDKLQLMYLDEGPTVELQLQNYFRASIRPHQEGSEKFLALCTRCTLVLYLIFGTLQMEPNT